MKLAGVRHLFVVPSIRTSAYVEMLANAFPDLRHSAPGDIQEGALPDLRNLVIVDNEAGVLETAQKLGVRSAIDWREVLLWREDAHMSRVQRDICATLDKDEVINLQFTRCVVGRLRTAALTDCGSVGRLDTPKLCRCVLTQCGANIVDPCNLS